MRLTLTGTRTEITRVPEQIVFARLTPSGVVRFLHLADVQISTQPYTGLVRLTADLVEGDANG
ncbi:hypothetical protein [Herbidospora daliensis]|uniref:hypothetical protein n=1 Tax=Herbidospora daliensis TaxID=295585 RepID=UPI000780DA48|nr:hypothetical protein [Herbidospora daliensis]